jgi:hypothetical protein
LKGTDGTTYFFDQWVLHVGASKTQDAVKILVAAVDKEFDLIRRYAQQTGSPKTNTDF